ncbi:acetamidase [Bosea thiooxidans]|uniref:Acetamidase n=1 Tax=Bosea thiooxidans TaxID=53254 RepID=A0A0Q3KFJ2_9HYPH|nr:acetamidase/formamidase family protein [Bosea thiooxidans]KQK28587.1 acetamidase [Bosea thiooxidans]SKC13955.1 Acetamidase/formamidase [Bosea thiooxidans]
MARHHFVPTRYSNEIGTQPPVLEIASGDSVITTTLDAAGFGGDGEQHAPRGNPMTGPFFVTGAEPGDALLVTIERMTPNRKTGWTYSPLAPGVLDPSVLAELPKRERYEWAIDAEAGTVKLLEPTDRIKDWSFPLAPMLGCFGVAPERGQAISTATSGAYGGNMDYRLFGPGATIAFPVFVDGALFFLGDGHACQGDGEIAGTGVETSFEVEFSVKLVKRLGLRWPRCETETDLLVIAAGRPLDQPLQFATTELLRWVGEDLGVNPVEASHLLGQAVRYDIANVFNPAYCVAARLAKTELTRPMSLLART